MTFGLSPYSVLRLVRQRIHALRQSTRLSGSVFFFLGDDFWFVSVFSVEIGSTADTCLASVYEAFWKNFSNFSWWFLRDAFKTVSEFSASLGSTMDTCLRQSIRFLEDFHMLGPSYFSTMLGSTVDSCSFVRLRKL